MNHEVLEAIEVAPVGGAAAVRDSNAVSPNSTMTLSVSGGSNEGEQPSWGPHPDPGRVPCCVNALAFPSICTIL